MAEQIMPLALSGEEVKEAIMFKVRQSLSRTCNLHNDSAYTSFKAEILIRLTLSDYGRDVSDNHLVEVESNSGLEGSEPRTVESNVTLEPMPPNQLRVETDQPVPVKTTEKGKQVIKHVKYAQRKV